MADLFAERLVKLRKTRMLTQRQVADAINVSVLCYQRYEYADRMPSLDKAIRIAELYSVSLDYLAGRTANPEINY